LNWGSAFLPGDLQATSINTSAPTVEGMIQNIHNDYFNDTEQRRELDLVQKLHAMHSQNLQQDPQLEARIKSFEMAYRMQIEATDAFDISKEPQNVRTPMATASGKAVADRTASRGRSTVCRFGRAAGTITRTLKTAAASAAKSTPAAGLLADLKQRGLLDSTLRSGAANSTHGHERPQRQRQSRPRSQQQGVQHVARGRRREGRHHLWED
jgi:hypothetical protein